MGDEQQKDPHYGEPGPGDPNYGEGGQEKPEVDDPEGVERKAKERAKASGEEAQGKKGGESGGMASAY
jgi:hypothetical protein